MITSVSKPRPTADADKRSAKPPIGAAPSTLLRAAAALLPLLSANVQTLAHTEPSEPQQAPQAAVVWPKLGDPAPPLGLEELLQAPQGAETTWRELRGNVVIVEFWATWCAPCIAAIPHLNALAAEFKDKPVRFISITDQPARVVQPFLKASPIDTWIGIDTDGSSKKAYGIQFIPHTLIVDAKGKLVAVTRPKRLTRAIIQNVLDGKAPGVTMLDPPTAKAAPTESVKTVSSPTYELVIERLPDSERRKVSTTMQGNGTASTTGATLRMSLFYGAFGRVRLEHIFGDKKVLDKPFLKFSVRAPDKKDETVTSMLFAGLERTFDVTIRREKRNLPVIVIGKGPDWEKKMTRADEFITRVTVQKGVYEGLGDQVSMIPKVLDPGYSLRRRLFDPPIALVDEAGIEGHFNFKLTWNPDDPQTLFESFPRDLGLTFTRTNRMMDVLVVKSKQSDPSGKSD